MKNNSSEKDNSIEIFEDVREFFESPQKQKYLTTVISVSNVEQILLELEERFIISEDFEKCAKIKEWREKL